MELQRQMGFASYQTAWCWLHKIRKAMVRPDCSPLADRVEADETLLGGAKPGKRGRGAAGKTVVAGAVESGRGKGRGRRLGRLRLQAVADASAASLERFLDANIAKPVTVATDGWRGYRDLASQGYHHEPIHLARLGRRQLAPARHPPRLRSRQALAPRHPSTVEPSIRSRREWPRCSKAMDGAVRPKHLQAYLDEYVFRFNRRTGTSIGHRFARLIEQAVLTPPVTYRAIVGETAAA